MARSVRHPLRAGWVIVDGRPLFHRSSIEAGPSAPAMVHVHGFGISGTYLEPTAARLASRFRTFVPDLPGIGRSARSDAPLDVPGLARALIRYCNEVGVERATFVGNSLGCPVIVDVAASYPDRIERAVLVSPTGGPNNQPLARAVGQMALDTPREPVTMYPIALRDYLRFGLLPGLKLFRAMTRFPTLERIADLTMPTLLIVGARDPLVRVERGAALASVLPHVDAVRISGAHALNYSRPELVAALIEAHVDGRPLVKPEGLEGTVSPSPPPRLAEKPSREARLLHRCGREERSDEQLRGQAVFEPLGREPPLRLPAEPIATGRWSRSLRSALVPAPSPDWTDRHR